LPKTSSGKLQRSACRNRLADGSLDSYAVFPSTASESPESTTSASELEALIGKIWAEQLNVEQVNADDHFFLLGGNSIAATQVIARVREELALELNLRLLFEAPTLAAFAAGVAQQQQDGGSAQGAITALSRSEPMPQSLAQNRLWITWQLDPQSSAYNIPGALRLRGELDEDALRASFQQLIERHESLRTRFFERDGVALQQVAAAAEFNLQLIDISDLPAPEREARAQQIREDEARTQFDLEKGPLLWVTLVRLDDEDHQLLVTMHHIIADGWSLNVLIDEFSRLYAAASQGATASLAPLPTQYADYGSWQRQWLAHGEGERQLAYWKSATG
jgi:acyl carrier protein